MSSHKSYKRLDAVGFFGPPCITRLNTCTYCACFHAANYFGSWTVEERRWGHESTETVRASREDSRTADHLREGTRWVSGDKATGLPSILLRVVCGPARHTVDWHKPNSCKWSSYRLFCTVFSCIRHIGNSCWWLYTFRVIDRFSLS